MSFLYNNSMELTMKSEREYQKGNYIKAEQLLFKALSRSKSSSGEIYFNLYLTQAKLGKKEQALENLFKAGDLGNSRAIEIINRMREETKKNNQNKNDWKRWAMRAASIAATLLIGDNFDFDI